MKIKLVVASMSLLGLVSCPVFAATTSPESMTTSSTMSTTTPTHKHHHKHHHAHHKSHHMMAMVAVPVAPMAAEAAPVAAMVPTTMVFEQMNQSVGRSVPMPEWFNRIGFSGGMNVDAIKWGTRNANFEGENYKRVSLNDVYLNTAVNVNDWTRAFLSLSFANPTAPSGIAGIASRDALGQYSAVYSNNNFNLEQGYVTIGNFDMMPVFLQLGKQYTDFSRYTIHPITRSLTQVLSESLQTSAKAGFILPIGLNGSVYAFDNSINKVGNTQTGTNYGAALGFDHPNDQLGYNLGVGWMYNMIGANDVSYAVASNDTAGVYQNNVGAVAAYAGVNSGPFNASATYTTALSNFNVLDMQQALSTANGGAKPWAWGLQAGYGFNYWAKSQNVYLGYQASGEAAYVYLPTNRWQVGYNVDFWKNTNFGLEYDHDTDYSVARGGKGQNANLLSFRAAVKFG